MVIATVVLAAGCSGGSGNSSSAPSSPPPAASPSSSTPGKAPSTSPPAGQAAPDWPTYHGGNDRAGNAVTLALRGALRVARSLPLDGAAYAQPIVVAGNIIVATEHDTVYSVSAATGSLNWRRQLGSPTPRSALPCGNIDPSGITGSPAYDARTHLVFVVTETSDAHHTLVALDAGTGALRWQRNVDVLSNRDRHAEQERGALLVAGGRVYVAFGGRLGDCGNYVGYVVASAVTGTGPLLHYEIPTAREAGIWASPGPVVGPGGDIYIASGNGAEVGGRYDGSDSVVRLSSTLQRKALFAPSTWPQDNAADLDLGSMSPAIVGNNLVVAGKRGVVYLLSAALGGVGGERATLSGCAGFGGAAVRGTLVVLPCSDGLRALRVTGASMHWLWRAGSVQGSPLIAGDAVFGFDGSNLVELSLSDGHTRARVHVGTVTRFTTPVPLGNAIVVATTSRLVTIVGGA